MPTTFNPRIPPSAVVPADVLPRKIMGRKRGRPRRVPADLPPAAASRLAAVKKGATSTSRSTPSSSTENLTSPPLFEPTSSSPFDPTLSPTPVGGPTDPYAVEALVTPVKRRRQSEHSPADKRRRSPSAAFNSDISNARFDLWSTQFHQAKDLHLTGDLALHKNSESANEDLGPLPSPLKTPGLKRVTGFLRKARWGLDRDEAYRCQAVKVHDLLRFFERLVGNELNQVPPADARQRHDYNLTLHTLSNHATIEWLDGPGLAPADIRARRLRLHVNSKHLRRSSSRTIWRVIYTCNNSCKLLNVEDPKEAPLGIGDSLGQHVFAYAQEAVQRSSKHKHGSVPDREESTGAVGGLDRDTRADEEGGTEASESVSSENDTDSGKSVQKKSDKSNEASSSRKSSKGDGCDAKLVVCSSRSYFAR